MRTVTLVLSGLGVVCCAFGAVQLGAVLIGVAVFLGALG